MTKAELTAFQNGLILGCTLRGLPVYLNNGGGGLPPPYALPDAIQQVSSFPVTFYNSPNYPDRELYLTVVYALADSFTGVVREGDTYMIDSDCWLYLWYENSGTASQIFTARYQVGINWNESITPFTYSPQYELTEDWQIGRDNNKQITWNESINGITNLGSELILEDWAWVLNYEEI